MVYLKSTGSLSLYRYPNVASPNSKIIGLIAGRGQFPFLFARAARDQGIKIIAAGIVGDASPFLYFFVDKFQYFKVGELKKLFEYFRESSVSQVIMAGQVNQDNLFNPAVKLDEEFQVLSRALRDRKADTIFSAGADRLQTEGMTLLDSTFLLKKYLAPRGTLTKPSTSEFPNLVLV